MDITDINACYVLLRKRLLRVVPYAEIIHVGSTAIRGMTSKGDLDVNVRVERGAFTAASLAIRQLGFQAKRGTLQSRTLHHLVPLEKMDLDVAIQLTVYGSRHDTFVLFNEILRRNRRVRTEYRKAKAHYDTIGSSEYRRRKATVISKYLMKVEQMR